MFLRGLGGRVTFGDLKNEGEGWRVGGGRRRDGQGPEKKGGRGRREWGGVPGEESTLGGRH